MASQNGDQAPAFDFVLSMPTSSTTPIYELEMRRLNGELESLRAYEGEVLLMVNVASKCGFTPLVPAAALSRLPPTSRTQPPATVGPSEVPVRPDPAQDE